VPDVDSNGNLWLGDYGGFLRYDDQGWQRLTPPELEDVEVYWIEIGPGDVQWLEVDYGLMRYDPATGEWATFTGADHPLVEEMETILASSDGSVWLGGEGGLVRFDGSTWSTPVASGSAPQWVFDIAEAPDGSVWVAADGEIGHLAQRWLAGESSRWP
jgi:ligand-binding sensor domain-containing protein